MQFGNLIFLYVTGGIGSCVSFILLLYNVVAAVLYMREQTEGSSSGLAKAAWAIGLIALMCWAVPCIGVGLAATAIIISRVERGRIYRDESSLAGATPVRMGSVNGGVAALIQVLLAIGFAAGLLTGGAATPT